MEKRDTFLIIKFGLCLLPFSNSVPLNFPALWSKEHIPLSFVFLICFRKASVSGNGMFCFLPTVIHWLASGCITLNLTAVFPQVPQVKLQHLEIKQTVYRNENISGVLSSYGSWVLFNELLSAQIQRNGRRGHLWNLNRILQRRTPLRNSD